MEEKITLEEKRFIISRNLKLIADELNNISKACEDGASIEITCGMDAIGLINLENALKEQYEKLALVMKVLENYHPGDNLYKESCKIPNLLVH